MAKLKGTRSMAQCTLFLETEVSDAPALQVANVTLIPFALEVTFLYDFDVAAWGLRAQVFGSPVLRSGARGKRARSVTFHEDNLDDAPQWIVDYVCDRFPPVLPSLERIAP